ncbi:hypothetical protein ECG_09462 [Echinococcus granulosus]|nr:hypothetical protein ECG_09455 [Echinococcus granulosus]KAH9278030.1 hypothetical protein ECG_09462 [Echinococcus granulosus]
MSVSVVLFVLFVQSFIILKSTFTSVHIVPISIATPPSSCPKSSSWSFLSHCDIKAIIVFFTFHLFSQPFARDQHRLSVPLLQPPNNLPSLIFTVTTKRLLTSGATIVSNTYKILDHTPTTCRYHCGVGRTMWNAIRPFTLSSRSAVSNSSKYDTLFIFTTINNR